jgi:hypothetical protein
VSASLSRNSCYYHPFLHLVDLLRTEDWCSVCVCVWQNFWAFGVMIEIIWTLPRCYACLYVCCLFYGALSATQTVLSNERIIGEWWIGKDLEGSGRGLIEGTSSEFAWRDRKSTNILNQDSRSTGRDFNLGPPEYEARALTTWLRRWALCLLIFDSTTIIYIFLCDASWNFALVVYNFSCSCYGRRGFASLFRP